MNRITLRRKARRARDPRHIVIIVQNLPVPLDRRVWLECLALREAGFDVSVICPKGPDDPSFEVLEGVRIYKYKPAPATSGALSFIYEFAYSWIATAFRMIKIWRRQQIDAIQACNPPDTYFALAAPLRRLGTRFVFDQHDLCPEVFSTRFEADDGLLLRGLKWLEKLTYKTADHVISTNESYKSVALDRGRVAPSRITVVRNGPDTSRLQRVAPDPSLKRGRKHLCVYLGVMGPQDGVDIVLHAARTIIKEMGREDVHFALLGFGDCLEDLKRLSSEFELDDHVTFTGRVGDDVIRPYLSTADIGLSPDPMTPFNDLSTMNKTMEYMAFGLPVVAFDLTETRVTAGDAALYVDQPDTNSYAKAIVDLLDDPGRRSALGEWGMERVRETLAWHHQKGRYLEVYRRLLGAD